jgi:hypothetical protein
MSFDRNLNLSKIYHLEKVIMRKPVLLLILLLSAVLLVNCGTESPTPTITEEIVEQVQNTPTLVEETIPVDEPTQLFEGYPAEGFATSTPFIYTQDEGYPVPENTPSFVELPDELSIPTPESDKGIVAGQLLNPGPGGEPYFASLYLARTIDTDKAGYPPIIAFSEIEDPLASQDKTGRFLFEGIEPGTYALAIWTPIASTIIQDPETGDYMLVEVRAGEVLELGVIGIP